jgi:hypothetical protein
MAILVSGAIALSCNPASEAEDGQVSSRPEPCKAGSASKMYDWETKHKWSGRGGGTNEARGHKCGRRIQVTKRPPKLIAVRASGRSDILA